MKILLFMMLIVFELSFAQTQVFKLEDLDNFREWEISKDNYKEKDNYIGMKFLQAGKMYTLRFDIVASQSSRLYLANENKDLIIESLSIRELEPNYIWEIIKIFIMIIVFSITFQILAYMRVRYENRNV